MYLFNVDLDSSFKFKLTLNYILKVSVTILSCRATLFCVAYDGV